MNDPVQLREAIMAALSDVVDPETGVDVVRMRLIEDLTVDAKGEVAYTFRPSSALCPLAVPLAVAIHQAVAAVSGVSEQQMKVVGYVQAEELTALMAQVERPARASGNRSAA
jgi:metal-sulfur cluster biosynthetic enzyme